MTIIKKSILLVSETLTYIVNLSTQHGIVPDEKKIRRVIPIFKFDDQSLFTNYRPISVLPSFSKFFEKSIYKRLMQYLINFNILCSNKYGFRKLYQVERLVSNRKSCPWFLAYSGTFTGDKIIKKSDVVGSINFRIALVSFHMPSF